MAPTDARKLVGALLLQHAVLSTATRDAIVLEQNPLVALGRWIFPSAAPEEQVVAAAAATAPVVAPIATERGRKQTPESSAAAEKTSNRQQAPSTAAQLAKATAWEQLVHHDQLFSRLSGKVQSILCQEIASDEHADTPACLNRVAEVAPEALPGSMLVTCNLLSQIGKEETKQCAAKRTTSTVQTPSAKQSGVATPEPNKRTLAAAVAASTKMTAANGKINNKAGPFAASMEISVNTLLRAADQHTAQAAGTITAKNASTKKNNSFAKAMKNNLEKMQMAKSVSKTTTEQKNSFAKAMAQNTARLLQNQKQALKQIGAAGLKQNRMEARKKMQAKAGQMAHSSSFANAMKHNVARMVQNQQAETKATVTRQHQVENKPSFTKAVSQHFAASHAFADAAKAFARKTETEKKVEQKKVAVRTNDGDTTSHAPSSFAASMRQNLKSLTSEQMQTASTSSAAATTKTRPFPGQIQSKKPPRAVLAVTSSSSDDKDADALVDAIVGDIV